MGIVAVGQRIAVRRSRCIAWIAEMLALQIDQEPVQFTTANLGPALQQLRQAIQERIACERIERAQHVDHVALLGIIEDR